MFRVNGWVGGTIKCRDYQGGWKGLSSVGQEERGSQVSCKGEWLDLLSALCREWFVKFRVWREGEMTRKYLKQNRIMSSSTRTSHV